MKFFNITYLSFEGRTVTTSVEAMNEDEAIEVAYNAEGCYSSDNIYKIIEVEEVY